MELLKAEVSKGIITANDHKVKRGKLQANNEKPTDGLKQLIELKKSKKDQTLKIEAYIKKVYEMKSSWILISSYGTSLLMRFLCRKWQLQVHIGRRERKNSRLCT